MLNLIAIFLGGGIGAASRYGLASFVQRLMPGDFPWGTFAVNVIGAFVMGALVELFALKLNVPETTRLFLTTGVLGGFTTFSAFSLESASMVQRGDWLQLGLYAAASVIGTIAVLLGGMALVRSFL